MWFVYLLAVLVTLPKKLSAPPLSDLWAHLSCCIKFYTGLLNRSTSRDLTPDFLDVVCLPVYAGLLVNFSLGKFSPVFSGRVHSSEAMQAFEDCLLRQFRLKPHFQACNGGRQNTAVLSTYRYHSEY